MCNDVCIVINRCHVNTNSSSTQTKTGKQSVTRNPSSPTETLSVEVVAVTMSIKKQMHKH